MEAVLRAGEAALADVVDVLLRRGGEDAAQVGVLLDEGQRRAGGEPGILMGFILEQPSNACKCKKI